MTEHAKRRWRAVALGLGLVGCGITGSGAWAAGMWGLLTGSVLVGAWMLGLAGWNAAPRASERIFEALPDVDEEENRTMVQRLLLDAAPTPLVEVEGTTVRALNRAARTLFGTDDRIVPPPAALIDHAISHLHHEGRRWRIDRIEAGPRSVAALIDFAQEEHAAEARASAELIEILGHELLNGLSPIVSLAESAQLAARRSPIDAVLLGEILGPLARRAEGLQNFASRYRALARLPEPAIRPVALDEFVADLARAFSGRWPAVALVTNGTEGWAWPMDRDQMTQAVWALLQNAAEAVMGQQGPEVGLTLAVEGGRLALTVTDNGPGVAPERAAHVFRPFHTTKADGSGIGLSLARQIARIHRGSLVLAGANPTCFRLTVPR